MTRRAVSSVLGQTITPSGLIVEIDTARTGAATTRNKGLQKVTSEWVAFLDSDDQLKPKHLETLLHGAQATGADYVFSWYEPVGFGSDPLPHFGKEFDPENPHQTTITTLVRTELAQQVGFKEPPPGKLIHGQRYGEDFLFTVECVAAGAKVVHIPERTWIWNYHGYNTSGLPTRGDARV